MTGPSNSNTIIAMSPFHDPKYHSPPTVQEFLRTMADSRVRARKIEDKLRLSSCGKNTADVAR